MQSVSRWLLAREVVLLSRLFKEQSAKTQIALGQAGIVSSIVLIGVLLGLVPDRHSAVIKGRAALLESVAVNTSIFVTQSELKRLETNLQMIVARNEDILSAAVRTANGKALLTIGEHETYWHHDREEYAGDSQLSVPIWEGKVKWGSVELRFKPLRPDGWVGIFYHPTVQLILFLPVVAFFAFLLYLGKMLKHLDPSQAIPGRVRSALDTMAEGLLVLDARQNVVLANEAFAAIVNQTPERLLGSNVQNFAWTNADGVAFDNVQAPWSKALEEGAVQMGQFLRLQLEHGKDKTFMANCSPVMSSADKANGVLVSFDDVTELREKELQLRKSKAEAEQANRAKSDFLANMSHEIRTPMNAIIGFTEVLKRGYGRGDKNDEKQRRHYLNTIANSSQHLLDLINDILDLSKVEAGQIEVESISCALHLIIQEVVQIMRVKAKEKGIALKFCPQGPLPEIIQSDPARLRQILTNLVGNAIKFTERGSVTITTQLLEDDTSPGITIDVVDTGIGMTSQQAAAIFTPFAQADSSITRRFGGTGLGLTISKRFAEALGGEITVRSTPGKGSVFSTLIPTGSLQGVERLAPAELVQMKQTEAQAEHAKWQFPAAKVLVVDDGKENRELLTVVLEELGLQVSTAGNGQVGLNILDSEPFDMVLMDVQMPVMDGYTTVAKIREKGMTLPVVALTAHAMKGTKQKCAEAGYSGYLTKPINISQLVNYLAQVLGGKPAVNAEQSQAASSLPAVEQDPIRSSLPISNPKYQRIVQEFVVRLDSQLKAMDRVWQQQDFAALADLAHWLKGSAGTVGFHAFTEPAADLEQYAKGHQQALAGEAVELIRELNNRIQIPAQKDVV